MEMRAHFRQWLGIDEDQEALTTELRRLESLLASNALQLAELIARQTAPRSPKLVTRTWSEAKRLMEGAEQA